jgi:hypothetical protein
MSLVTIPMDVLRIVVHWIGYRSPIQRQLLRMVCKRYRSAVNSTPLMDPVMRLFPPEAKDNVKRVSPEIYEISDKQLAIQDRRDVIAADISRFYRDCVERSDLKFLTWALEVVCVPLPHGYNCKHAIRVGNLQVFEYLFKRNVPLGCSILTEASAFGKTDIINWALEKLEDAYVKSLIDEDRRHRESKLHLEGLSNAIKDITGRDPKQAKVDRDTAKHTEQFKSMEHGGIAKALLLLRPERPPSPGPEIMLDMRSEAEKETQSVIARQVKAIMYAAPHILGKRGRWDET